MGPKVAEVRLLNLLSLNRNALVVEGLGAGSLVAGGAE
jgi:hypothetical protein